MPSTLTIIALAVVLLLFLLNTLYRRLWRPPLPPYAPPLIREGGPILGATRFFRARWDFFDEWTRRQKPSGGSFSFYAGPNHVVGLSGDEARKFFFDHRELHFGQGYFLAFGATSGNSSDGTDFDRYFAHRLSKMLKRDMLVNRFPGVMADTRSCLEDLKRSPISITNPFDSIYKLTYQLTLRISGCDEIVNSPDLLNTTLNAILKLDEEATPFSIAFPGLALKTKLQKMMAGYTVYQVIDKIIRERKRTGSRPDDAMQLLLDQGDDVLDCVRFIVGAVIAGLLNAGINLSWLLIYLGKHKNWLARCREEVNAAVSKYSTNKEASLVDQLGDIPFEAWENEFPVIDMCLRETMRLQVLGACFRKNVSGRDLKFGEQIIPKDAFVTYHLRDIHHDPEVYTDPDAWDPARFFPDRAEDKKKHYAFCGWGLGRHPCLGMRFAKLEINLIVAYFISAFDFEVTDPQGSVIDVPAPEVNSISAKAPSTPLCLKYRFLEKGFG